MDEKVKKEVERISELYPHSRDGSQADTVALLDREIKLATEADYEYVNPLGGSAAANTEIMNIMNMVEGVYQQELGLSFRIVYQHTWATPDDPYDSTAPAVLLQQFEQYWNTNLTGTSRDTAHMWTGRDLDQDTIGFAEIGTVCRQPSRAYGLSQRVFDVDIKVGITAHEIGHNLGATHPDEETPPVSACVNSIMESHVGYSRSFCQFSRDQITNYVNANASCLSATYSISGHIVPPDFRTICTLTLTGTKSNTAVSDMNGNYAFHGLPAGGTYTITPSQPFHTFNPVNQTISNLSGNLTEVNFAASLVTFSISGRIADSTGVASSGVQVSLNTTSSNLVARVNTDADGNYIFQGVPAISEYVVSPFSPNHFFTPTQTMLSSLQSDRTHINFTLGGFPPPSPTPTPPPGSPFVTLSSNLFNVNESLGSASITVRRFGDISPAVTVDYATSDTASLSGCNEPNHLASERCDYATTIGTLRWDAGDGSDKTITVPIVDDQLSEGQETFRITLSNAHGAFIANSTATIIINDNDTGLEPNPINRVDFFVRQQYIDFLGRLPDQTGFSNWVDTLSRCPSGGFGENDHPECDRIHVSMGFFQSEEFLGRAYFAFRFYMTAFNQRPRYAQFIPDMALVGGPKSPAEQEASAAQFSEDFVQRPEFQQRYGQITAPAAYVDALLQTAGVPNLAIRQALIDGLQSGTKTRGRVLREIVESSEVFTRFLTDGTVAIQYFGYLRRDPDEIGYQNWVTTLRANPNNLRHMVFGFLYSTEYRGRFGQN